MQSRLAFRIISPRHHCSFISGHSRCLSTTPRIRTSNRDNISDSNSSAQSIVQTTNAARQGHDTVSLSGDLHTRASRDEQNSATSNQRAPKSAGLDKTTSRYPVSFRQPQRRSRTTVTAAGLPTVDAKQVRLMEAQLTRMVRHGDIYAPHDLSATEQLKAKQTRGSRNAANRKPNTRKKGSPDDLDALAINPIEHYKNFSMMSEFMSEMGRIKHGRETGFRAVNQRRMAKAVRRAIGIGIMPSVHKHPELFGERMRQRSQISVRSKLTTGFKSF